MRKLLAITDVTHMWGDMVCIAGLTEDLQCIRPVVDGGVRIWSLYKSREPVIFPSAKIWMDLTPAEIIPPHIEDQTFDPSSIEFKDRFEPRHWEKLLSMSSLRSVQDIFDGKLADRRVAPGAKTRSLGTIKDVKITDLRADSRYDRIVWRLDFEDESGEVHTRFPVNDLAFRGLAQRLYDKGLNLAGVARTLLERIDQTSRVYLRIGLARPTTVGSYDEACWVQVTGVYTFPDYLNGRIWADFE